MLYVVGRLVRGIAVQNNVMYVVCYKSSIISTYSADTLSPISEDIDVEGMTDLVDMGACRHDRQLYVLTESKCIYRVLTKSPSQYEQWLTVQSTGRVKAISVTSRRVLVTSWPRSLHQYNTTDRQLLRVVQLPQFVRWLSHAVETARETFIVCHHGTAQSERQSAVSKRRSLSSYDGMTISYAYHQSVSSTNTNTKTHNSDR